jgi:23S rRNA (adenine2503-C2)-methyltransferase
MTAQGLFLLLFSIFPCLLGGWGPDPGSRSPVPVLFPGHCRLPSRYPLAVSDSPTSSRPHLLGMLPAELAAHIRAAGVEIRDAEARRVLAHAVARGLPGFPEARPVPARVREAVDALFERAPLALVERAEDPSDGFVKYLFRSPDGVLCEAVRIPLERAGCFTVCLSSQVGCAMGCAFCTTGRLGLERSLLAWEMVSAFLSVRAEAPGRITGAVFMGQGEPLANLDEVLRAASILCDPCGGRIPAEAISISTVGVVPAIRRYTAERRPFRLIVSLSSVIDDRRAALLPAAARWQVAELVAAIREYQAATGGRVSIAWVVLAGVNTGDDEIERLGQLFAGVPIRLNLIDVNDPRPHGFRRASDAELASFRDRLRVLGVPVVRRYAGGAGIHAACGMLAAVRLGAQPANS